MRTGWSGEVRPNVWIKVDADDTDIRRMLAEAGFAGADPAKVPTWLAFKLLDIETERLILAKMMARYGHDPEAGRARMAELNEQRDQAMYHVKALVAQALSEAAGDEP